MTVLYFKIIDTCTCTYDVCSSCSVSIVEVEVVVSLRTLIKKEIYLKCTYNN